jgi:hypothetical protein
MPQRTLPGAKEFDQNNPAGNGNSSSGGTAAAPNTPPPIDLAAAPNPNINFDGMGNANFGGNTVPPDAAGAVGTDYYVQFLNSATSGGGTVGIYNKVGGTLAAQF